MMATFAERMVKVPMEKGVKLNYPVEVRDAGNMGLGVFATSDIKKGEICCYYDGVYCSGYTHGALIAGKRGFTQQSHGYDGALIAGFPAEFRRGGCSQMINDFNIHYSERDIVNKNSRYARGVNVFTFTNPKLYGATALTIASKDIKKGEQLFVSYGCNYWKVENKVGLNRDLAKEFRENKVGMDEFGGIWN
jgi:hypothetical protein